MEGGGAPSLCAPQPTDLVIPACRQRAVHQGRRNRLARAAHMGKQASLPLRVAPATTAGRLRGLHCAYSTFMRLRGCLCTAVYPELLQRRARLGQLETLVSWVHESSQAAVSRGFSYSAQPYPQGGLASQESGSDVSHLAPQTF
jgi:hypothetical protein